MLYLLDANVLIDANRDYYPLGRVPEFWEWLIHMGKQELVKVPIEIYEEIREGNDDDGLTLWSKDSETETSLLLREESVATLVSHVIDNGYASDLTDDEVEQIGRDPFLIAYALASIKDRCVVTSEGSKPGRKRANRHIPDICKDLGISCCSAFEFTKQLNFNTNWEKSQ